MAITTLDGVLAGNQNLQFFGKRTGITGTVGKPFSLWAASGIPGPGSFDNTLNGVVLSSTSALVNGQIPHYNPGSGNAYISRFAGISTGSTGTLLLCDRLWHNGNMSATSTSAQTMTTPTWPARDNSGSTNGVGVYIGLEVSGTMGSSSATISMSYTNTVPTSGRTSTMIDLITTAAPIGTFYRMGLAAGDLGVKSLQSVTFSATMTSGTINVVAYRVLASVELTTLGVQTSIDALTSGFPRIYDGTVPFLMWIPTATTPPVISGTYTETQG